MDYQSVQFRSNGKRDDSRHIQLQLQRVLVGIDDLRQGDSRNQRLLDRTIGFLLNQEQSLELLQQRAQQYLTSTDQPSLGLNNSTGTDSIIPQSEVTSDSSSTSPLFSTSSSGSIHLRAEKRYKCKSICSCSCHRKSYYESTHIFKNLIGSLFAGYAGLPVSSTQCDTSDCQTIHGMNIRFHYVFPCWLLNWAICITMAFTRTKGPELILRCLRVRSQEKSLIFQSVGHTDSNYTMSLIAAGLGSVVDVDEHGYSILTVCIKNYSH